MISNTKLKMFGAIVIWFDKGTTWCNTLNSMGNVPDSWQPGFSV